MDYHTPGRENSYLLIAVDFNGVLWCGTTAGLKRYDGETWTTFTKEDGLIDNNISDKDGTITIGLNGEILVGTARGVSCYDGESWTTFTIEDGLGYNEDMQAYYEVNVTSIDISPDGLVWVGTRSRGISCYDGVTWKNYTTNDGLINNCVKSVAVDSNGIVWVGTYGGISCFDPDKQTFVNESYFTPSEFTITGNYPNPFNAQTTLTFILPHEATVNFTIYNLMGQRVRSLLSENLNAGIHSVCWNGCDESGRAVSSGIYLSCLKSGANLTTRRIALVK